MKNIKAIKNKMSVSHERDVLNQIQEKFSGINYDVESMRNKLLEAIELKQQNFSDVNLFEKDLGELFNYIETYVENVLNYK